MAGVDACLRVEVVDRAAFTMIYNGTGSLPANIAENSGPADWIGSLAVSGDIFGLLAIEAVGPAGRFF